jgi:hypothetical protein
VCIFSLRGLIASTPSQATGNAGNAGQATRHGWVPRLYRKLGFEQQATIVDRFRVDGLVLDDVVMTLRL